MRKDWPTGFISGVGGNANGLYENYIGPAHAIGQPVVTFCNDDPGGILDSLRDPHPDDVRVFRVVKTGGEEYAVPRYDLSPQDATVEYYDRLMPHIPPEIKGRKELVEIKLGNELSYEKSDWLGWWGHYNILYWLERGWNITQFGFAAGTPRIGSGIEPNDWEAPGMLQCLKTTEQHWDRASICLHEYSYTRDNIWNDYPYLIGRFQYLFQTCDKYGIRRPRIRLGEWGWELGDAPGQDQAMRDMREVAALYSLFGDIAGGTWTLHNWWAPIYNKIQKLIKPTGDLIVAGWDGGQLPSGIEPIVPSTPPEPPPDPPDVPYVVVANLVIQEATLDQKHHVVEQVHESRETILQSADDAARLVAPGKTGSRVKVWGLWPGIDEWLSERGVKTVEHYSLPGTPPDPPPQPPEGVDLLPYMAGVLSGNGPLYELQTSWGPQERVQTQWHGDKFLITKGNETKANWEERWADSNAIYFGTDTSESEERYYTQRSEDNYGAAWAARKMAVGEWFYRAPDLVHYRKSDCVPVQQGHVPSLLQFSRGPMVHEFKSGIILPDVIELIFAFQEDPSAFVEKYLFAKGYGLVGWESSDGRHSWISEIHQPGQRPDNKPLVINCLDRT